MALLSAAMTLQLMWIETRRLSQVVITLTISYISLPFTLQFLCYLSLLNSIEIKQFILLISSRATLYIK